jgi:parallel beta-helix repeat protein
MKIMALVVALILTLLLSIVAGLLLVKADQKTIVVPDNYPTITSAMGNATNGGTIFVRAGIYEEHSLDITKSIKLIGENAENTMIKNIDLPTSVFGSSIMEGANAITISADNVIISGFKIISGGRDIIGGGEGTQIVGNILEDGLQMQRGSYQTIAKNMINGTVDLMSPYTYFVNNTGDCHLVAQMAGNQGYSNVVFGNTFTGLGAGILLYQTHDNMVAQNIFVNCSWGISSEMSSHNIILANTISNGDIGFALIQGSEGEIFYANNIVKYTCAVAVSGNNTFYDNNFINNKNQVESADLLVSPNPPASIVWDNGREGNFWDSYKGVDENRDGIGDAPYVIDSNNSDRYPLVTPFDISMAIVNLPAWAEEINLVDNYPLSPTAALSPAITSTLSATSSPTSISSDYLFNPTFLIATVSVAVMVAVASVALVYLKHRKKKLAEQNIS